jgi:SAM-dependent methyltransferase
VSDSTSALRRIVDVLSTCDVDGWLAYDSLMSVTRDGHLDANDPLAVAFLARERDCVGATVDSFRIARALRGAGMEADARGDGRCDVAVEVDGTRLTATVQGCWQAGDRVVFATGLPPRADVDAVLPLGEADVDGTALPVPADPARVLTAVYGDTWGSQQRPFRLRPRAAAAAVDQGRGYGRHRQYWERFYQGKYGVTAPHEPSLFARWVTEHCAATEPAGPPVRVVDVGCGNGRDARHFADRGHAVLGLDYSYAGLAAAHDLLGDLLGDRLDDSGRDSADAALRPLDLNDARATLVLGAELAQAADASQAAGDTRPPVLYARFVAHAVDDHARDNLWRLAALLLRRGGRAYLEFRTHRDARTGHVFEEQHYRRYLDPDDVQAELKGHGGVVVHREEGRGLAPFRSEDPDICRMVVQWAS